MVFINRLTCILEESMNKEEVRLELVEEEQKFDEVVEGYDDCDKEGGDAYACKRDCWFVHNSVLSTKK